ncbi:hypothetical protein CBD41_00520 [bacterium TMED181]|nr:hypothetical protein [Planctomycetota bacterium]OUW47671.1 MAG: hypothetical protein CBD41_00520 [bacterium TMED181]
MGTNLISGNFPSWRHLSISWPLDTIIPSRDRPKCNRVTLKETQGRVSMIRNLEIGAMALRAFSLRTGDQRPSVRRNWGIFWRFRF